MQLCGEDKLTRHKSQHRHEAHPSFTLVCGCLSIYTKFRKSLLKTVSQDRKANGFPYFPFPSLLGHQLRLEKLEIPKQQKTQRTLGMAKDREMASSASLSEGCGDGSVAPHLILALWPLAPSIPKPKKQHPKLNLPEGTDTNISGKQEVEKKTFLTWEQK